MNMCLRWCGEISIDFHRLMQECLVNMETMLEIFEEQPEIEDNGTVLFDGKGQIEFRNVSFGYKPDNVILKNVSFTIPSGQTFAVVGRSGGGKSTILKLIFRFFDPHEGEILIDGQNIAEIQQNSLRRFLGIVPQDTILFNDTIV